MANEYLSTDEHVIEYLFEYVKMDIINPKNKKKCLLMACENNKNING